MEKHENIARAAKVIGGCGRTGASIVAGAEILSRLGLAVIVGAAVFAVLGKGISTAQIAYTHLIFYLRYKKK